MICKAVQITKRNEWIYDDVDIGTPSYGDCLAEVVYSSLCCTDLQILNGSLLYYRNGTAKYPIVTGHEWCGYLDGTPVTSLCIMGDQSVTRHELGVIGRNGAHAKYVIVPKQYIVEIPEISHKYSLLEPVAVVMHGLFRVNLSSFSNILVNGYGSIGRICKDVLRNIGVKCTTYDPRFNDPISSYDGYDLFIECSGSIVGLERYLSVRGGTILAFGFEYNAIEPGVLVANEISFIGTLGCGFNDFQRAIEIMPKLDFSFQEMMLDEFERAIFLSITCSKVVFNNKESY